MNINSYLEQWVSGIIIIHSWKYLEDKSIDYMKKYNKINDYFFCK